MSDERLTGRPRAIALDTEVGSCPNIVDSTIIVTAEQVRALYAEGLSTMDIARRMGVDPSTFRSFLRAQSRKGVDLREVRE